MGATLSVTTSKHGGPASWNGRRRRRLKRVEEGNEGG